MNNNNTSPSNSILHRVTAFIRHPRMSGMQLTLAVSVLLVLFYNNGFWVEIFKIAAESQQNRFFLGSIFVLLVAFINLGLSVVSFRPILKPSLILILVVATLGAYFMKTYGLMIDRSMIRNVLATDLGDISELFNIKMLYYLVVLGGLPSLFVWRTEIRSQGVVKELFMALGTLLVSLAVMVVLLVVFYKDYISLGKNYNYVRHLVNPVNSLYAIASCAKGRVDQGRIVARPVGEDAHLETDWQARGKKNLVILVVGEAARARQFSLNGYEKKTNPFLEQEEVLSFTNTSSCGTVTTTSLPCMFSHFGRESFSDSKAQHHEGLLDVVSHGGVQVLWRENNSGCKGVCDRVEVQVAGGQGQTDPLCATGECQDMILLAGVQEYIEKAGSDTLIVLHQKGSYGPGYYRRTPAEFKRFLPECTTNQLQECRAEELVNAYDNTIVYTDYFLSQVIDLLKKNSEHFNTSMLYLSDYGESLGEKNIYLHGLPYVIAPEEQKRVPFILWFGDAFLKENRIDKSCLQKKLDDELSHDNLFHSVLGLLGIKTVMYEKNLDIFSDCRR